MKEDKKKEEETIGDGLYRYNYMSKILEIKGGSYRISRHASILTRRRRFSRTSEHMRRFFIGETTFVLPNEFLS